VHSPESSFETENEPRTGVGATNKNEPLSGTSDELLNQTANKTGPQLSPNEVKGELDIVGRSEPESISEGPYVEEVKLPNDHEWKRTSDETTWCRFSPGPGDCFNKDGTPVPNEAVSEPIASTAKTDKERNADFRKRIDSAPNQEAAEDIRYERYKWECDQEGRTPLPKDEWQVATDRLRANQLRGRENEDAALEAIGVQNNNYAQTPNGQPRNPITYESQEGVVTRPDSVTDSKWIDVKSAEQGTVYYTEQLRAQKEGAVSGHPDGRQRDLAVVISNDQVPNADNIRPSRPLADNALVFHRNSATGEWAVWDKAANRGQGGWKSITDDQAASSLGGKIPQQ
jgi:hypothetical protein